MGMRIAKMIGAWEFSQNRAVPRPVPIQTPRGPMRKAVTGIMMTKDRKGTKTICTLVGTTLTSPL